MVLASYLAGLILTQFLSYSFSPILPVVAERYRVSPTTASWTVLVFPLVSALTSSIAGGVADRFGSRFSIRSGLLLIALFSTLRVCSDSFVYLMLSQAGIAVGIPLVVIPLSAFVAGRFDALEQPPVTALCTVGLFVGIGLSLEVSPWLVLTAGYSRSLMILACIASLCFMFFFVIAPKEISKQAIEELAAVPLSAALRNRNVLLLCLGGFLAQGSFNAIITWIATIWHERGIPLWAAGTAGSAVVFSGILGSLLVPLLANRRMGMRTALWFCLIPPVLLVRPFIWTGSLHSAYIYGSFLGFFQFPSLAITLTLLERSVPKKHIGLVSGLYWTTSNVGTFVLSHLIGMVHQWNGWHAAIDCVVAALLLVTVIVLFLRVPAYKIVATPTLL